MKGKNQRPRPREGPRESAWHILIEWEKGEESLEALREKSFTRLSLNRRDKGLVTELTQGVVRHRLFLEHNLKGRLARPDTALPEPVRQALFLGLYQLLLLDRIPSHSAVDESVHLVKNSPFAGFSGLVNALLRKAASSGPVPLPDFKKDPILHIELSTSFPRWMVERLSAQEGIDETRRILESLNGKPPLTLRVNTLQTSRQALMEELDSAGIRATPGRLCDTAILIQGGWSPLDLPSFQDGRCAVQDEGAQIIAPLCDPRPGLRILDACAAPGGKTGHLAQITGNRAFIAAVDRKVSRVRLMAEGLARLGVEKAACLAADMSREGAPFPPDSFQRILLDAPCSGIGVLRRHPEGKWNKDPFSIPDLVAGQLALLSSCAALLIPGGFLLYSTCSLLREENEEVVGEFLAETRGIQRQDLRVLFPDLPPGLFSSEGDLRLWPHRHHCDGFYACLMKMA